MSAFFSDKLKPDETSLARMRIATVHRVRVTAESASGPVRLTLSTQDNAADFAVGDWILVEPDTQTLVRRLDRKTALQRRTEGGRPN